MPLAVVNPSDGLPADKFALFELANPALQLNLSSDPWNVDADREAVQIVGRDVITNGSMRPDTGRFPVTISNPLSTDLPIVSAEPMGLYGQQGVRFPDRMDNGYTGTLTTLKRTYSQTTYGYAWVSDMIGAYLVRNEDERNGDAEYSVITAISTTTNANDTITFTPPFTAAWDIKDKFYILFPVFSDKRGIWLSNGRKFWLLHGGTLTAYLDLNDNVYLGTRWRGCQISRDRYMFVTPAYPPRVIDLNRDATASIIDNLKCFPGLFPPGSPAPLESLSPGRHDRGLWGMQIGYISGYDAAMTTSSRARIMVRAVNLDTQTESEFVQVRNAKSGVTPWAPTVINNDPADFTIGFPFTDGEANYGGVSDLFRSLELRALFYQYVLGDRLVIDAPSTVAGVYRLIAGPQGEVESPVYPYDKATPAGGAGILTLAGVSLPSAAPCTGYIETRADGLARTRLHVYAPPQSMKVPRDLRWTHWEIWRTLTNGGAYYLERRVEMVGRHDPLSTDLYYLLAPISTAHRATCELSDSQLIQQPQLQPSEFTGGRLPPVCKAIASLGGVTISCGAGTGQPVYTNYIEAYGIDTASLTAGSPAIVTAVFDDYHTFWAAGDVLVIVSPPAAAGTYPIVSANVDGIHISITAPGVASVVGTLFGHIERPQAIKWPVIRSDEEVYTSRSDKFSPESYMTRVIRLSTNGDIFQGCVSVSNYVAIIMQSGIHLLRNESGNIIKDTIAVEASGTIWPDSIAVVDDAVVWAHQDGPKVLQVHNDPNQDGRRGAISWLDPENRTRTFFREAFENGYSIDTGIDTLNQCVRFRRTEHATPASANVYTVLQYSIRNKLWTVLEDDNGLRYARAKGVTANSTDDRLYSVPKEAAAFELNTRSTTWPYTGKTVQATLGVTHTITTTSITKTGIFSAVMMGDVIRFRSTNTVVDGQRRVIRTATANAITFDAVTGLAVGDEFLIGATRFAIRSAPMAVGDIRHQAKTLHALQIRALQGARTTDSTTAPTATFTARTYRNNGTTPEDHQADIKVYNDELAIALTDEDRVSSVVGQGSSLQLEIEHLQARTDFALASAAAIIREESSQLVDASTDA